jgi:hypothetical protein
VDAQDQLARPHPPVDELLHVHRHHDVRPATDQCIRKLLYFFLL